MSFSIPAHKQTTVSPQPTFPLLRAAFTTAESGEDGYFVKHRFSTLAAMQAAHHEWVTSMAPADNSALAVAMIREAIDNYYLDLGARKHGGVAMDLAFNKIERVLGVSWQQHQQQLKGK